MTRKALEVETRKPEIKLVVSDVDGVIRRQNLKFIHETYLNALKNAGVEERALKRFNFKTTHALRKLNAFINKRNEFLKLLVHLSKADEREFKSITESAKKGEEQAVLKFLNEREAVEGERVSAEVLRGMNEAFKLRYSDDSLKKIKPYKNALSGLKLLEKLGVRIVFVSSAPRESVKKWLEIHYGKGSSKRLVVFGREDAAEKPSPEGILRAVELHGVKSENALYVGDHVDDVIAAKNAGIRGVGVLSDLSSVGEFLEHDPHYVFHSFKELADWISRKKVELKKMRSKTGVTFVSAKALKIRRP